MKLYKHEYSSFLNKREFSVIELEVEEKTKIYKVISCNKAFYGKTFISKESINKLQYSCGYFMYSFSTDNTEFIRALVAKKEQSIKNLIEQLENANKEKKDLLEMLGGVNNG